MVRRAEAGTLTVEIEGVSTSFFIYAYPLLRPLVASPWPFCLAAVEDIAAMKVAAIAGRGSRKDFVDLYVVCREVMPLAKVLRLFDEKFHGVPFERYHVLKSLTHFDDAEREPMPEMIRPVRWEEVRAFLVKEAPRSFAEG